MAKKKKKITFDCREVNVFYGKLRAIKDLNLEIEKNEITALIGPSGCGKSTFLRSLNRMNDFVDNFSLRGKILLDSQDIYAPEIDPVNIRLIVGMVFQKPNPFPKSIYENIALVPRINKYEGDLDELVKNSLKQAYLWEEVKDKLSESAYSLSGGQQQRLCIARALAMKPKIILLDEPTSALDPISSTKIEELLLELKKTYTIIIVTHNMQQAARIGNSTAFFHQGKLIEHDYTDHIFMKPQEKLTEQYITGKFG